jgi:hypothetical protein
VADLIQRSDNLPTANILTMFPSRAMLRGCK